MTDNDHVPDLAPRADDPPLPIGDDIRQHQGSGDSETSVPVTGELMQFRHQGSGDSSRASAPRERGDKFTGRQSGFQRDTPGARKMRRQRDQHRG